MGRISGQQLLPFFGSRVGSGQGGSGFRVSKISFDRVTGRFESGRVSSGPPGSGLRSTGVAFSQVESEVGSGQVRFDSGHLI